MTYVELTEKYKFDEDDKEEIPISNIIYIILLQSIPFRAALVFSMIVRMRLFFNWFDR